MDGSGLVLAHRKALRNRESVWALEEFDGKLWSLQGVSDDPGSAARYVLENGPLRGRRVKRKG